MDWLKKLLEAQGLTETQIKVITEGVGANYKTYIPQARFDEVNKAKKQAEKDRDTVNGQLEELKKSAGASEDLKKQIETLQADNKTAKEKYEADLKELRTNTALKMALTGQVYDADLVAGLLDKSKIELDDAGSVKAGLDDQIKALRESKAFLFVEKQPDGQQFQFKGVKPAEGSDDKGKGGGGHGDKEGDFGKRLAEFAKQNESLDKARQSYFE